MEPIEDESSAIRQTVAAAEKYQSDVEPFVALHTDDAIIVNIAGRRVLGRAAIQRAMSTALEGSLSRVFTSSEIDDIRFVRPDVAIVSCIKHVSDERDLSMNDGGAGELPPTGSLTYVLVKERGAWSIALAQTTPIKS
jgi:uncharacterized protein (TIGR02246 family)